MDMAGNTIWAQEPWPGTLIGGQPRSDSNAKEIPIHALETPLRDRTTIISVHISAFLAVEVPGSEHGREVEAFQVTGRESSSHFDRWTSGERLRCLEEGVGGKCYHRSCRSVLSKIT